MACEPDRRLGTVGTVAESGRIQWAIGGERGEIGFAETECVRDGGRLRVSLRATSELQARDFRARPFVLIAELPASGKTDASTPDFGASLFLPNVTLDGRSYPMLQLLGQAMPGVPENVGCGFEEESRTLTCQHMRVMPWLSPGVVPHGALKVRLGQDVETCLGE